MQANRTGTGLAFLNLLRALKNISCFNLEKISRDFFFSPRELMINPFEEWKINAIKDIRKRIPPID